MPDSNTQHLRCFISLNLPDSFRKEIAHIQRHLADLHLFKGKFTSPQNLHLTLKFLGEISPDKVEEVRKQLHQVQIKKSLMSLGEAGVFSPKKIKIIWVKVNGADDLQKQIDQALAVIFPEENRFMGHITIARVKSTEHKKHLTEVLNKIEVPALTAEITCFFLMRSTLTTSGPIYEVIEKFEGTLGRF